MLVQVIAPRARVMIRFNQLQLQGTHIEKSELGPRFRRPAVVPGLSKICRIRHDNIRLFQSKKVCICPANLLNVVHQNSNLRNHMIAQPS
ncbi:hypothetical protein D3C86_1681380 [compost metagenome]